MLLSLYRCMHRYCGEGHILKLWINTESLVQTPNKKGQFNSLSILRVLCVYFYHLVQEIGLNIEGIHLWVLSCHVAAPAVCRGAPSQDSMGEWHRQCSCLPVNAQPMAYRCADGQSENVLRTAAWDKMAFTNREQVGLMLFGELWQQLLSQVLPSESSACTRRNA